MKPTLLVLAAGMGSRYGGLKQMDPLGPDGETIIDYSVFDAVNAGFGKIVYIVRSSFREDFEKSVKDKYGDLRCPDGQKVVFEFVEQELYKIPQGFELNPQRVKPWGTAHALLMAKDVVDTPFAVINGDDYYGKDSFNVIASWLGSVEGKTGRYSMVSFRLANTLSESGGVSRGVCSADADGLLTHVEEHHDIVRGADGKITGHPVGGETVVLDEDTPVSMNMWGFTPDYLAASEEIFRSFLEKNINELKAEFYIPYAVDCIIREGKAVTELLTTTSKWFGVTFKEDRPAVVARFEQFAREGVYPSPLFGKRK